eukprot:snap_masked-scaffold_14-processed-gene-3.38-mRNA-1 protein AED:0.32 eAED:0.32 QI:0/-1/0/1/-1/1/1/0/206
MFLRSRHLLHHLRVAKSYQPKLLQPKNCFATYTQKLPHLGDSIASGSVNEWLLSVGDTVQQDDVIVVIDTDKVSVEIKADVSGKIIKLFVEEEGEEIKVNEPLLEIDTDGAVAAPEAVAVETNENKQPSEVKTEEPNDSISMPERVPLIKFRYGKLHREQVHEDEVVETQEKVVVEDRGLPLDFGRLPPIEDYEIEVLNFGGAEPY